MAVTDVGMFWDRCGSVVDPALARMSEMPT